MTDTRVRVPLNGKQVDLAALDADTGGHGLCSSDDEVVAVEGSPVTAEQLQAALAAHTPPDTVDPDDELRAQIEAATTVADLKAALLGTKPGQVARVAGRSKDGT